MKAFNKLLWILFVFFAIIIGLYPFGYILSDTLAQNGLLSQKPDEITTNSLWSTLFYIHIFLGGIALLSGWSQFHEKLRKRKIKLHRVLGKVYLVSVLISGISGVYIAIYAEGGIVAKLGFLGLAIAWLFTSITAYLRIKKKNVTAHKKWMIRSFALTFAAVTLRIWLPFLQYGIGMDFISAYVIIAWLCWVPNLLGAEWKVKRLA